MNDFNTNLNKANTRRNRNNSALIWWNANSYKVWRIVFFPVWIVTLLVEKFRSCRKDRMEWDESKAEKMLNKHLPKALSNFLEEDGSFFVCPYSTDNAFYDLHFFFDRKMNNKEKTYFWKFVRNFEQYLWNSYEIPGYQKFRANNEDLEEWKRFKAASGINFFDEIPRNTIFFKKIVQWG